MKLLIFLLLLLCSCDTSPTTSFKGVAMTIPYEIQIGAKLTSQQQKKIETVISETFKKVDSTFNNWNPDSEVSYLASLKAEQKVKISQELIALLELVDRIHTVSQGRFDPTIAPLGSLWKQSLKKGELPADEQLVALEQAVGWDKIHLEGDLFWKEHEKTSLDLGGIAKGLAVDMLCDSLKKEGFHSIYVEWGGEIKTYGLHPESRPWNIAIRGVDTIALCNEAIATSGNYFQLWEVDGLYYTHILDPKTKEPLQVRGDGIASTTVVADSCALADGLATCLMLFPTPQEAKEWAATLPFHINCWIK